MLKKDLYSPIEQKLLAILCQLLTERKEIIATNIFLSSKDKELLGLYMELVNEIDELDLCKKRSKKEKYD